MDDLEQEEPMVTAGDDEEYARSYSASSNRSRSQSFDSSEDDDEDDDDDMPLISLSTAAATKVKKKKSRGFEHNVEQLKDHKAKYGHFDIDWKHQPSLYTFCSSVRSSYHYPKRGYHRVKLNEHRIALLDSIGFDWKVEESVNRKSNCPSNNKFDNPPKKKKRKYNKQKSNDDDHDESLRKQPPEELVYQAQPLSKTKDAIRERQDAIEILAGMKTSSSSASSTQHGLTHNLIGKKQDTKKRKATEKSSKKRIYNPSMQWGSGVTPLRDNKWQAQISYNSKPQYIGMFDSKEVALLAVKLARDKLTTFDGSTYEGDELKRIIKCARDAAHAGEQAQVTAAASSSTTTATGQSKYAWRKLCSHEGCDSFARGKEGTCVKHSESYQMAVDPNLGGGTCSHCNKTFTTEAGLLYHLGESCFVSLMLFVAY